MGTRTGRVRNGLIEVEGLELPEGAQVIVSWPDEDKTFELTPEEEAELLARIEEADRGDTADIADVRALLRRSRSEC